MPHPDWEDLSAFFDPDEFATSAVITRGEETVAEVLSIFDDPNEHRDLSSTMSTRKAKMMARLRAVGPTVFQSDMNASFPENLGMHDTSDTWKTESGFVVPWLA